jgi:hypothetical protein
MSEYRSSILRNAVRAAIGISLIISVAVFGSTIVTQIHSPSIHSGSSAARSQPSLSGSTAQSGSSFASYTTLTDGSDGSSNTTTSSSSSPITQYPPSSTVAEVSFDASAFAYDNYTKTIFAISNGSSNSVLQINGTTNEVLGQISLPTGSHATSLIFDPVNRELYVALNYGGPSPHTSAIALTIQNDKIMWNQSRISIEQLALDPVHNTIYGLGLAHSGFTNFVNVAVINGTNNSVEKNVTLFQTSTSSGEDCCFVGRVLYNPVTDFLYASIGVYGSDGGFSPSLAILNTLTDTTLNLDFPLRGTFDFSYSPTNGYTYIAESGYTSAVGAHSPPTATPGGNVTVLNGSTFVSTIRLGNPGQNETVGSEVYDSNAQSLFVANGTLDLQNHNFVDRNVTIINATSETIIQVIPMQIGGINSLFLDPSNGDLYVASPNTIYVVSLTH